LTCVTVDNQGSVFVSTNDRGSWSNEYAFGHKLTGVSCAAALVCATVDSTGNITTFSPIGAPRTSSFQFNTPHPFDITAGAGGLWVDSWSNNTALEYNEKGVHIGQINGLPMSAGPKGLAVGSSESLYVAESLGDRVERFSLGELKQVIGEMRLAFPSGVAVDANSHVFVADGTKVDEFNATGVFEREFGEFGTGLDQLRLPQEMALDSHGNLWIADKGNNRIDEFSSSGSFEAVGYGVIDGSNALERCNKHTGCQAGIAGPNEGQLNSPTGLAIDSEGNVFVTDMGNARVEEYDETGKFIAQFGSRGAGAGQLTGPDGVAVDSNGNVWVSDENERVTKWG
jgi:sugar lactone lactonase YvrE